MTGQPELDQQCPYCPRDGRKRPARRHEDMAAQHTEHIDGWSDGHRERKKSLGSWSAWQPRILPSTRRCDNCGGSLAQTMIDAEPDTTTHPACDDVAVWLRHLPGYVHTRRPSR